MERAVIAAFALLLTFSACTESPENGTVVARVNDKTLTMEQIRAASEPSRPLSANDVRQYANRWVISEMLYQEAQQRGYDESEQILSKVEEARKQLTIAELLEKEVYAVSAQSIPQSEVSSYFQSHSAEFLLKENLTRLSVAVFAELEPANQFRTAALGSEGWTTGLQRFAGDAEKGLISAADSVFYTASSLYPPELWKVATALGMLEVSFPVKTSVGFVVMRSLGQFKSGTNAPLSYVEPQIRSRLLMERRQQQYQQYIQRLRTKHAVQMTAAADDSSTMER